MKHLLYIVPLLAFTALPWNLEGVQQGEVSREVSKTLDLENGGKLRLDTYKGSVLVTSWDRQEVEVRAVIEAPEGVEPEHARELVDRTRVEIYGGPSSVTVKTDHRDVPTWRTGLLAWNRTYPYVHYEIKAPRELVLSLDDHKSDIEVLGFQGRIDIDTHKGTIEAQDLAGRIHIETHKGRAELTALRGAIEIETHKGVVRASIDELENNSRVETHKGRINLQLRESQAAEIRADLSRRADFRTSFDLDRRGGSSRKRGQFKASLNGGGGPTLTVVSHKGHINIDRQ